MKSHYIRLGPAASRTSLRSLCGRDDSECELKFVPRGRQATCGTCTRFEQSERARISDYLPKIGEFVRDSAGLVAYMVELTRVPPGVEVVQAWEPFLIVAWIERKDDVGRFHFTDGHIGGWCELDSLVPVRAR